MARIVRYTDGSVTKRDGYWRLTLDAVDVFGKRHRRSRKTAVRCSEKDNSGKAEAEWLLKDWRNELVVELEENGMVADAEDMLVCDYIDDYLASRKHEVAEVTMSGYENHAANIRLSSLGQMRMGDVGLKDVQAYERSQYEAGLARSTVAHRHAFLSMVFKYADAAGDIRRNPMAALRAPKAEYKAPNPLNQKNARRIMGELAAMKSSPCTIAARIALFTGMRRGEICALRWLDWDEDESMLHVTHALTQRKRGSARKPSGYKLASPKDTTGRRTMRDIPVPPELGLLLYVVREKQRVECTSAGCRWDPELYIIGDIFGRWTSPDTVSTRWATIADLHDWRGVQGRVITFHDLRHTFATIAIAEKTDVMSLAAIMGHSDPTITLKTYAIALAGPKRQTMSAVGGFYSEGESGGATESPQRGWPGGEEDGAASVEDEGFEEEKRRQRVEGTGQRRPNGRARVPLRLV